ncbi:MAG: lytic transglycosylase domain-containing protein [Geminicoccaceae bacterium]
MRLLVLLGVFAVSSAHAAETELRQRLAQLLAAADDGQWSWAARLAEQTGVPVLGGYVRWRELLESRDRPPFAAYAAFLRGGGDWPSAGVLQARAEDSLGPEVTVQERLEFFAGRAPRSRQGRILYADALLAAGREQDASALLRESWVEDDFSDDDEAQFLERYGSMLRGSDDTARLDRLLWDRRPDQVRRMLARVSGAPRVLGTVRLKLQLSDPAVDSALAAVPAAVRRDPGLLYDRLRWRRQQGNDAGVREILLNLPDELRRPELWWREQEPAIRAAIADRSYKLAYRLASTSRQQQGAPLTESGWLAGWLALQFTGQPKAARGHFERLWPAVATPISKGRAGYWAGRAAAATGDSDKALRWYASAAGYPSSFYGQLAARELGQDPATAVLPAQNSPPAVLGDLRRRKPAQIATLLCRNGQPRYAQPFFRHLGYEAADNADELRAVVDLAQECNRADLVLAATRAAAGNGTYLIREAFPVPAAVELRAEATGVAEPALVLAVARQESLFDPAARSPVGAIGLMQLMPGTAQSVARELGETFSRGRLAQDPSYNLRLGASYLGQQLARFDNEPVLALAAYNAGPRRVTEWLEVNGDPRGSDPYRLIDWIELIPFAETRNYVQRVLEGRTMYRILLGQPTSASARAAAREPPSSPRSKPAS